MSNWRNRPTFIDDLPTDIKYIMFIDENGDPNLKSIERSFLHSYSVRDEDKYFTVTGCVIEREQYKKISNDMLNIKKKYWPDGKYLYGEGKKQKLKRVCFHSYEIRNFKGPFSKGIINYNSFINDISNYMSNLPITIFSSSINKEKHWIHYYSPHHPYSLCLDFVLERFVKFYLPANEYGIIILEARGKKEDRNILNHIKNTIDYGTAYVNSSFFKKIKGVYFNTKWEKTSNEQKTCAGLEIADLCSYPIYKYCRSNEKDLAFQTIEKKIYCYPDYIGKGIKIFP